MQEDLALIGGFDGFLDRGVFIQSHGGRRARDEAGILQPIDRTQDVAIPRLGHDLAAEGGGRQRTGHEAAGGDPFLPELLAGHLGRGQLHAP
jgi:hypothetical protein